MVTFLLGFLIGIITIGSLTWRTISVYDGKILTALFTTITVSTAYWFGIKFIVTDNVIGYMGFALGEIIIVTIFTAVQKRKLSKVKNGKRS